MTNEKLTNRQAIGVLDGLWSNPLFGEAHRQAFEIGIMAIKALEQEPCEDAISRQATIEAFQMFRGYEANRTNAEWVDRIETVVKKLPPVNPQPKTGNWIMHEKHRECSKCTVWLPKDMPRNSFCPNCGACMKDCRTLDEFIEDSKESEE